MLQICLLLCNLNFNSYTIFNDLRDVIAVVSASLYPLKDEQIFHAVNCVVGPLQLTWEAFNENLAHVSDILFLNPTTARRSFFHSFFKRWFLGKTAAKDQGYGMRIQTIFNFKLCKLIGNGKCTTEFFSKLNYVNATLTRCVVIQNSTNSS